MSDEKFNYLLRLGDNALILGQRLTEWCGKGPALEEEMALANVGLDLLGQARLWLTYAGEVEGAGRNEDRLAFGRDAHDFRNLLLVEQPNGNYADTTVRQFLFDAWHYYLLEDLITSGDERIAATAEKSVKEVAYHLRRSGDLVVRMGDGTSESRARVQSAVEGLWMYTGEMFRSDRIDDAMVTQGVAGILEELREPWRAHVREVFSEASLTVPAPDSWMQKGGKEGRHSENLGFILAEMQFLPRAYPGAQW